jgi:hypothetical protein
MAIKTFTSGSVLTASDTNTFLANSGLVYIAEGSTSTSVLGLNFNNVFSSTYDNYRIVIDYFQPVTAARFVALQLRVGGVDTAANYTYAYRGLYQDGTSADNFSGGPLVNFIDAGLFNSINTIPLNSSVIDITAPNKTERTFFTVNSIFYNSQFGTRNGMAVHNAATSFTGFSLYTNGGNMTTLRCKIYGYRQA